MHNLIPANCWLLCCIEGYLQTGATADRSHPPLPVFKSLWAFVLVQNCLECEAECLEVCDAGAKDVPKVPDIPAVSSENLVLLVRC